MAFSIRSFVDADAPALADLTIEAIRQVGAQSYSAEQVAAWAARHPGPERFISRAASGERIFVAVDDNDCPVAYALLVVKGDVSGHLDMLYCHPAHTRQGLADRLLAIAEQEAQQHQIARLFTEASELARPAFERAGYEVTHRRDFAIEGVPIHNFAMEKHLN